MVSELKDLLTKEEALSIRTCRWRSHDGRRQAVCKNTDGTIVFSYCFKCDAFKYKDLLDKSWDPDAKDPKCPHFHEGVLGDWCELYEREQNFEKCEKCPVGPNAESIKSVKELVKVNEEYRNALERLDKLVKNDQTAKADAGKAQLSLVPQKIIYAIARIREYGNAKYPEGGKDNWKSVEKQRYVDAMLRHISAYVSDPEGVDEESGLPSLWHAACNLAFILEMEDE